MRRSSLVLAAALTAALANSPAQAQTDFYRGKTVTIVIGSRITGSLSIGAQILSRHLSQHIPGNPTVILRQLIGGAHLNATNYVYNVADADGLTVLAANPQVAMAQLVKGAGCAFRRAQVRMAWFVGSGGRDTVHPP